MLSFLSFCLKAAIDEIVILNIINTAREAAKIFVKFLFINSLILGINGSI